ncbi:MAG: hypothetical protein APR54_00760 [Candidatus Cloacimonas sp. SDB]|nr:MAG: hypothetical protein APR54_00760 [Candidatus Cloacimonas sp. SDB]
MSALIDAIGALIIGGLLLLIMVNTLFNIQAQSVDIEQQLILSQVSENIARIISGYLSLAGAGEGGAVLDSTGIHRLRYIANDTTFTSTLKTFDIVQGDSTQFGFPLEVYVDGNRELGPFFLSEAMEITYFDENDNEITLTNGFVTNPDIVRYIRLEFEFFYDAFSPPDIPGWLRDDPKNRIVLWRYFINTYL